MFNTVQTFVNVSLLNNYIMHFVNFSFESEVLSLSLFNEYLCMSFFRINTCKTLDKGKGE